jgi:hypothetical protein
VYNYFPDGTARPFIAKTPFIHSLDPEVFLSLNAITGRYYFMHILKKKNLALKR